MSSIGGRGTSTQKGTIRCSLYVEDTRRRMYRHKEIPLYGWWRKPRVMNRFNRRDSHHPCQFEEGVGGGQLNHLSLLLMWLQCEVHFWAPKVNKIILTTGWEFIVNALKYSTSYRRNYTLCSTSVVPQSQKWTTFNVRGQADYSP